MSKFMFKNKSLSDSKSKLLIICFVFCVLLSIGSFRGKSPIVNPFTRTNNATDYLNAPILISYSVTSLIPNAWNVEYFLQAGMRNSPTGQNINWILVGLHSVCSSCPDRFAESETLDPIPSLKIMKGYRSGPATLLYRDELERDISPFLSFNISLEYAKYRGDFNTYKYFFFVDNSVRGPFSPSYMPSSWHWTHAFLERMGGPNDARVVASSITCLPETDPDGFGPRLETYAFASDASTTNLLIQEGIFKYCDPCPEYYSEGYTVTRVLLKHNIGFATLLSRYARNTNWLDRRNWRCNNNVRPSLHGTYDGISVHPFEVLFVKNTWNVAEPYVRRYSDWFFQHLEYDAGTRGFFDKALYKYATSPQCQAPNNLEEAFSYVAVRATNAYESARHTQDPNN